MEHFKEIAMAMESIVNLHQTPPPIPPDSRQSWQRRRNGGRVEQGQEEDGDC